MRAAASHTRAVLIASLALLAQCHRGAPRRGGGPRPPQSEVWLSTREVAAMRLAVEPALEQPIDDTLLAAGRVAFDDARVTHVFSPIAGRIVQLVAQVGQRVRRGDALAVLLSPDLGSASADVDKARADLVAAEHDVRRQRDLVTEGAASQRDLEEAQDTYQKARAELSRTLERMRLLRGGTFDRVTQQFTLRAPIDGEVITRGASPGLEVQGQYQGGGAPELFTIGDLDRVWVFADVYEMDLARVHVGAVATVHAVAYPTRAFTGPIQWIAGALDPASRTARVKIALDNPDHALRPEMYARVSIAVSATRELAVPREAVLQVGDHAVVFVERGRTADGRVRFARTPVATDAGRATGMVPVTHGIVVGDPVVTRGAVQLLGRM